MKWIFLSVFIIIQINCFSQIIVSGIIIQKEKVQPVKVKTVLKDVVFTINGILSDKIKMDQLKNPLDLIISNPLFDLVQVDFICQKKENLYINENAASHFIKHVLFGLKPKDKIFFENIIVKNRKNSRLYKLKNVKYLVIE